MRQSVCGDARDGAKPGQNRLCPGSFARGGGDITHRHQKRFRQRNGKVSLPAFP